MKNAKAVSVKKSESDLIRQNKDVQDAARESERLRRRDEITNRERLVIAGPFIAHPRYFSEKIQIFHDIKRYPKAQDIAPMFVTEKEEKQQPSAPVIYPNGKQRILKKRQEKAERRALLTKDGAKTVEVLDVIPVIVPEPVVSYLPEIHEDLPYSAPAMRMPGLSLQPTLSEIFAQDENADLRHQVMLVHPYYIEKAILHVRGLEQPSVQVVTPYRTTA